MRFNIRRRVRTSTIRLEARQPHSYVGPWNPLFHYGSLEIIEYYGGYFGNRVYWFPRWNFTQHQAEAYI